MSWAGKILRVDLTAGTCMPETLNKQWARDYLGQRGLATKYFVEEVDAKVDPLSPANKIIWATGPLTGTMASTGGRYSVITKGALTGAIACSNSVSLRTSTCTTWPGLRPCNACSSAAGNPPPSEM